MNKRIIYTRPDGGVSIIIPCGDIGEAWAILPKDAINPQIVTVDDIPKDRTFRSAWEHSGDKITVNMDKAREIHLSHIRAQRNAALAVLDIETMKALGKGDNAARDAIEARKQALRDIPQTIDLNAAKTPEELLSIGLDGMEI